jgi:hypothetical protein
MNCARESLNPFLAVGTLFYLAGVGEELRRAGVIFHPQDANRFVVFFEDLKRRYERKIRAQALRKRRDWRKADIPALVELFLLPGYASPATQQCIARLIRAKGLLGPGVIPSPKRFEEAFVDSYKFGLRWATATSVNERRELRKKMPRVREVTGDRFGGEWPRERFRVHGIKYTYR